MRRSPSSNAAHGGRPYGARHTPCNWKSQESACDRGYRHFPVNHAGPRDDDFIPLDISTPMSHDNYNASNRYSPSGGRGSLGGGWYNKYRGNYNALPRPSCSNRYPAYKHSPRQFHGLRRKGYKGAHRQINVSAYVDMNSFLEDPWENLVKKLDNSEGTSRNKGSASLSSSKLVDSGSIERSESKLSKNTNLDDSQYSQECKDKSFVDTSFETDTDLSQISKVNSSIESETGDVCSSQDLIKESVCDTSDKTCEATQETNVHSTASLTGINQKDI